MRISEAARLELERFDLDLPVERAYTPPASWYTSTELYEIEREAVFGHTWQPVARVEQVREIGQYVAGCFVDRPWVITRDRDGQLRGFHNICRHKGREVVIGAGQADSLVCNYHAWSYDLSGRLRKAPQMAGIQDFDRDAMGLMPIQVEAWGPWVFINPDLHAAPLAPRLADLEARLAASGWSELRYVAQREWTLACNWKVYVDNYLDGGYHVPHMHPSLDAQLDMVNYRTQLFDDFVVQSCPSTRATNTAAPLDPKQRIGAEATYAWLFPNFMINRYGDCIESNYVIPQGLSRCKVVFEYHYSESFSASSDATAFIAKSIEQSMRTQQEDIEICESVQIGLASGVYDRGRYAPRIEHGDHHFHRLLTKSLRSLIE